MLNGLYASAKGMLAQEMRQESVTHNIANASTPGFHRELMAFSAFPPAAIGTTPAAVMPYTLYPMTATDPVSGALHDTGSKTDLALLGEGYFAVQTQSGEAYTRNGAFSLDAQQRLVTADGNVVLGQKGPITITSANWEVAPNGAVRVNGATVDTLKVVTLPANVEPARFGGALVSAPGAQPVANPAVRQGVLEGSNVNVVSEMVRMLVLTRQFEANQRAIAAQDSTLERTVNDVGRA
jgi:flagellar basal-body rod protein FlgG